MQQPYRNPYLCLTIVWFLGVLAVVSLLGIIVLGVLSKDSPSALIAIAAGSMGNLGSFLVSPPRGTVGFDGPPQPGTSSIIVSQGVQGALPADNKPAPKPLFV